MGTIYHETFDDGPGGWFRVVDNVQPAAALPVREGAIWSWGPWWVDYNHAPPGAGYLQLLMCLSTRGPFGEHQLEVGGSNRFTGEKYPLDFREALLTVRLKGELEPPSSQVCLLVQGSHNGKVSGWVHSGRPLTVSCDFTEQSVMLTPDPQLWTCLGARSGREEMYGFVPLDTILGNVNVNLYLVVFPVHPRPLGPLAGDPHHLRAGRDYPLWPSSIAQGYIAVDTFRVEFSAL